MCIRILSSVLMAILFQWPSAHAGQTSGGMFRWSQTRLSLAYMTFSGSETESPSTNSVGYGGEVGIKLSGNYLGVIGKVRGLYIAGTEPFMDGASETDLTYTMMAAEPHLGFILNLIPGDSKGFKPYIGVTGFGGMLQLRFDSDDVTTLKPSESQFYSGFEAVAGVELYFRGSSPNLYSVFGEIALRQARLNIADKAPYFLDGLVLMGGFSF
ncbi:MAG: hypothetical protein KDD38_01275 [Bdellovibrionales bacterium]|nr:hypothetical protein [Bdellovibrionales bacterium]